MCPYGNDDAVSSSRHCKRIISSPVYGDCYPDKNHHDVQQLLGADDGSLHSCASWALGLVSLCCIHDGRPTTHVSQGPTEHTVVIMAACVHTKRPLFHRTWERKTGRNDYSGSWSFDATENNDVIVEMLRSSLVQAFHSPTLIKKNAESQPGIMRTTEFSIQAHSDEKRPISSTGNTVPRNKGTQQ